VASVRIHKPGVREVLKTYPEVRAAIRALAEQTATIVREDESVVRHAAEVVVDDYLTDRQATAVTIKHPGGLGMEAKHGTVSRAAAAVGLEVKTKEADA
jgi:hypothetical protein